MRFLGKVLIVALVIIMATSALSNEILPEENLIVEGIPPIPASIVKTVERYTDFRSAVLASWHPHRKEMLISTRFGETSQVHQVKSPLGYRQQLTFFPERVSGPAINRQKVNILSLVRMLEAMSFARTIAMI